jgi:FkbM family methyltransferase
MNRPWSGLGIRIVSAIRVRQTRKRLRQPGPLGDFYRAGGNALLYTGLPLNQDDRVIDAGGYHGEWTAGILTRYGCSVDLFEPTPQFVEHCNSLFAMNQRVKINAAALGAKPGKTRFALSGVGTSAYAVKKQEQTFEAEVDGINTYFQQLVADGLLQEEPGAIGCMKLNIEGGEYEVLESLLSSNTIDRYRSLLIQFHRQPENYHERYEQIVDQMSKTHTRQWCFPFVWERWDLHI